MKRTTKKLVFAFALIIFSASALATKNSGQNKLTTTAKTKKPTTIKPNYSIIGNPLGGRDNYTINSNEEKDVDVECVFINTSEQPVDLNIWTSPTLVTPKENIHLEKGSSSKPFQVMKKFLLKLQKNWWCRIYTPHDDQQQWGHCAYFSISDAGIVENNPFATWKKKEPSKKVSYHCRIIKPKNGTGFFFYKGKE